MRRLYAARAFSAVCWFGFLTYLGAFLAEALAMDPGHIGLVYMAGGLAFFLGSLAVGGPLARVSARTLVVAGYAAMALLVGVIVSARLGTVGTVVLIPAAALAMGLGVVGMATRFLAETPIGAGTTMTLSGSIFNLGAAGGGAIGGMLLALSGYDAVAIGLPIFGLAAALLSWRPARA
jgi:predicted MFS family arabinose efflux permease